MAFTAVAERGSETEPFQLTGKNPLLHIRGRSITHDHLFDYSGGHLGFYGFLRVANARIERRLVIGLLDLPDHLWRDSYEDGAHPCEAADEFIAECAGEMGLEEP